MCRSCSFLLCVFYQNFTEKRTELIPFLSGDHCTFHSGSNRWPVTQRMEDVFTPLSGLWDSLGRFRFFIYYWFVCFIQAPESCNKMRPAVGFLHMVPGRWFWWLCQGCSRCSCGLYPLGSSSVVWNSQLENQEVGLLSALSNPCITAPRLCAAGALDQIWYLWDAGLYYFCILAQSACHALAVTLS